jgi:hypothetical protein
MKERNIRKKIEKQRKLKNRCGKKEILFLQSCTSNDIISQRQSYPWAELIIHYAMNTYAWWR